MLQLLLGIWGLITGNVQEFVLTFIAASPFDPGFSIQIGVHT